MPFDNVHQHMDSNQALTVWYKLFMKDWADSFLRPIPKPQKDHHKLNGYRILTVWRHKTFFIHFILASAVNTLAAQYLHSWQTCGFQL